MADSDCTCEVCGIRFKRNARNGNAGRCCSRTCGFEWIRRNNPRWGGAETKGVWVHWWFRDCAVCAVRFIARQKSGRLCSAECRAKHASMVSLSKYHAEFTPKKKPCPDCGAEIVSCQHFCEVCSDERRRAVRRNAHKLEGKNHRARARRTGSVYVPVTARQCIAEHGTRCWICKRKIDMNAKSPDPMSWSMDHVVPLSLGGWHDLMNVRSAHRGCNIKRGAEYRGQLMLCV